MKKFLSILLLFVLVSAVTVIAVNAGTSDTYWSVSDECLVNVKKLDDGTVPTFKNVIIDEETGDYESMLVGLPTYATVGGEYFQPEAGYSIKYYNSDGYQITDSDAHIGTSDSIRVFNSSGSAVAEYGLVTYGDADGDGVFDVIDSHYASLFLNEKLTALDSAAMYEAVKARVGFDDFYVQPEDYQEVVNGTLKENADNDKGRKIPVDSTIDFASAIYAYDGKAKGAATIPDATFKKLATVTYNGSTTVPTAAGIYAVDVTIANNEDYLVTPGTKNLGFVVIAPQASTGYKVTADNTNKKITIATTDNDTSNATLAAEFEKWLNSAYSLKIGDTVNPATVASALPNRSFEVYSGQKTTLVKTGNTAVLGSYLPDDETLWTNNTAANTKKVTLTNGTASFNFTLAFQQDEETVENSKRAYFTDCAAASRGQRSSSNTSLFLYAKEIDGCYGIRASVKDSSAKIISALGGTGLKGVLVGRDDSISIQSSSTPSFSGSATSLFDENGVRYSTLELSEKADYITRLANAKKVLPVVNKVLGGLGCSISTNPLVLLGQTINDLGVMNKTGYCNYRCSGLDSSIRYNIVFYLEFKNYDAAKDTHYTLTIGENVTVTAPVKTSTMTYDPYIRMAGNEPIVATAPAGYKVVLKDANGNEIQMNTEKGYYLMPYSNATITAVPIE